MHQQGICRHICLRDLRAPYPTETGVVMQGWQQHGWGCRQSGRWNREQHHAR